MEGDTREIVESMSDRELVEAILLELIAIREIVTEEHMVEYHGPDSNGKRSWAERIRGIGGSSVPR